ncbi:hypothetical protein [Pontibacter ruber]|uniref:Uncharacterized protein n=1 Tax=Pontibacter ruber TaxID=1343895 RepID=A0ABW5CR37_9BACT|nr:hypothetical protein [Pontibacter ruber]
MRAFLPERPDQKYMQLMRWGQLRREQLHQAILVTKDTVLGYLKRQIERGNWREVQDVLRGKPMTRAGKFLLEELRGRVVGNLIMRLGLRKVIAVGIAFALLPFILAKVSGELIGKARKD